jgi:bifunctional non-homologous end joining protein LigD
MIAVNISKEVTSMIPDVATSENTIAKRGNKIFIDYNQNDEADTVASAYSVRPFKEPNVSTPLEWKEVNERLNPGDFNIKTIVKRIERKSELWNGVLDEKIKAKNSEQLKKFL